MSIDNNTLQSKVLDKGHADVQVGALEEFFWETTSNSVSSEHKMQNAR